MLHFIVMDHDFLLSNDFAGEALLDLADVPGFPSSNSPSTLRQFNLVLMHPSEKGAQSNVRQSNYAQDCENGIAADLAALRVLASRKEYKEAVDFVRHVETVRNT